MLLLFSFFIGVVFVVGIKIPVPSQDPWYNTAPPGWENTTPGTVLRVRSNAYDKPGALVHPRIDLPPPMQLTNVINVVQIQYTTTNSLNELSFGVSTMFIPESHAKCMGSTNPGNCSHGLLSYQAPYDSTWIDYSPSYTLQFGDQYGDILAALNHGWFVSVPDYEGRFASFGANILGGHIVLDSIRASLTVARQFGFRNDTGRAAIWGYSSGGTVSEYAVEFAATYAPDLLDSKLIGAVIGGVAGNSTISGRLLNGKDAAGLFLNGIIGVATQYAREWKFVNDSLWQSGPYNATEFYKARYMTGWDALTYYAYQDIYKYFKNGQADVDAPLIQNLSSREGWVGFHGTPRLPVFMYQAIHDTLCPIEYVDLAIEKYCADGANILYHRNNIGDHNNELFQAQGRALGYLAGILDGNYSAGLKTPSQGCQWVNVTLSQNDTFSG